MEKRQQWWNEPVNFDAEGGPGTLAKEDGFLVAHLANQYTTSAPKSAVHGMANISVAAAAVDATTTVRVKGKTRREGSQKSRHASYIPHP